jgi:hypothetical protein
MTKVLFDRTNRRAFNDALSGINIFWYKLYERIFTLVEVEGIGEESAVAYLSYFGIHLYNLTKTTETYSGNTLFKIQVRSFIA